jgi:AraC family transcriptional regulator, transcriptional activator of pobA
MKFVSETFSRTVDLKTETIRPAQNMFTIKRLCGVGPNLPERLQHFEIIFLKKGHGCLSVDLRKYVINNNLSVGLCPGQYRMLELNGDPDGYVISFSHEFLFYSDSLDDYQAGEWVAQASPEMDELCVSMEREYQVNDPVSLEIIRNLFKIFVICRRRKSSLSETQASITSKDRLITQSFFTLLQKHFASRKLVADYADELCITPNYLNTVVKKQTGFPASHHIQQFIITEAKRQAVHLKLRMKEVADRLGFEDYAHFSKFFKNYSGVNFSSFKRTCSEIIYNGK